jgi:hypothetical protein
MGWDQVFMSIFFLRNGIKNGWIRLKDIRELINLYPECLDECQFDIEEECMFHETDCPNDD